MWNWLEWTEKGKQNEKDAKESGGFQKKKNYSLYLNERRTTGVDDCLIR